MVRFFFLLRIRYYILMKDYKDTFWIITCTDKSIKIKLRTCITCDASYLYNFLSDLSYLVDVKFRVPYNRVERPSFTKAVAEQHK